MHSFPGIWRDVAEVLSGHSGAKAGRCSDIMRADLKTMTSIRKRLRWVFHNFPDVSMWQPGQVRSFTFGYEPGSYFFLANQTTHRMT
jgi:hypothetical protein